MGEMYPFDRTCLAYAVSEPGEWTNKLIFEDLGGYPAGRLDRVIHAVARLRKSGHVEAVAGLRLMPNSGAVGLFRDNEREVYLAIRDFEPVKHADLAVLLRMNRKEVGRIARKLARVGLVSPSGRIWPTTLGVAALSPLRPL